MAKRKYRGKHAGPKRLVNTVAVSSTTGNVSPVKRVGGTDITEEEEAAARARQRRTQREQQGSLSQLTQTVRQELPPENLLLAAAKRKDHEEAFARFATTPQNASAQARAADAIHASREGMLDAWGYARGTVSREQLLGSARRAIAGLEAAKNLAGTLPDRNREALMLSYQNTMQAIALLDQLPQGFTSDESLGLNPATGEISEEGKAKLQSVQNLIAQIDTGLSNTMSAVNGAELGIPPEELEYRRLQHKRKFGRRGRRGRGGYGGYGRGGYGRGGMGMGGMGMGNRGANQKTGKNGAVDFIWEIIQRVASGGRSGG